MKGDNHHLPTLEDDGSIVDSGLGEKWSGGYGEIGRRQGRRRREKRC